MFGDFGGAAPPAPPPPAPTKAFPDLVAWEKNGVRVVFSFVKPDPSSPGTTKVVATYSNSTASPVTGFVFQAAVPKYMQTAWEPASGDALGPNNSSVVTQAVTLTNSQHGVRPLAMRIKIGYLHNGQRVDETAVCPPFPAGL